MKIENLNFTVRTYNILKRAKIDTMEQLQQLSDDDLMCVRNLGRHSLEEIHEKLESYTMTNGDRIRAMSDEELAEFLNRVKQPCDNCQLAVVEGACTETLCDDAMENWLKQPIRENGNGTV